MDSPIQNRIGAVFVPVSDMRRAIEWYSELFGLPPQAATHEGTIYDVVMLGDTGLLLDSNKPVTSNSVQPLCFFWTNDMQATLTFLQARQIPILSSTENIGSVTFLLFADPDQNLLMVCQRN